MRLSELLSPDRVRVPLRSRTKDELLRELVELAVAPSSATTDEVLRLVAEREAELSTGIGGGVAIPHARSAAVHELRLAAGATAAPVEFGALDGAPVRVLFLLVAPESDQGSHVKALSRIARLVRRPDVRERLASAPDPATFLDILRASDAS